MGTLRRSKQCTDAFLLARPAGSLSNFKESSKRACSQARNGIEVMRVDSQFFHVLGILKYNFDPFLVSLVMIFVVLNYIIHSTTCEQAYSGARNSGFSDYACPPAEYMPGFQYILHLTLSIPQRQSTTASACHTVA
jgi:hypothetical protein